ncbi:MAG: hypothetical protein LBT25_02965, partial [Candidatus Symbiothrix sp.]|nr:hypothetical protein [Candidatus Symbiothrix sp.]
NGFLSISNDAFRNGFLFRYLCFVGFRFAVEEMFLQFPVHGFGAGNVLKQSTLLQRKREPQRDV